MPGFDLRSYLDRFPEVCKKKFGRTYSFQSLEKKFEQLRSGKRWLVAKDVLNIFDPAQTALRAIGRSRLRRSWIRH